MKSKVSILCLVEKHNKQIALNKAKAQGAKRGNWSKHEISIESLLSRCSPEAISGCFHWDGVRAARDYGGVSICGKLVSATRVVMSLLNGRDLGEKEHVLHFCDNPGCIRPSHLFIGSHKENMADMSSKGRACSRKGEKANVRVLNNEAVLEIRQVCADRKGYKKMAEKY